MVNFPSRPKIAYGDVAAIAEIVRPIITAWYSGEILIYNPSDNTKNINIDGGVFEVIVHPYWGGPARIQQLRRNLDSKQTTNDTTSRTVQFQCDYAKDGTLPDVLPGHEIIVINGGNNHLLTLGQFVISGTMNSSSAWQNTIITESNLEARPNYVVGEWV